MYRFEIVDNNLVVTNTATNDIVIDHPRSALALEVTSSSGYFDVENIFQDTSSVFQGQLRIS